MIHVPLAAKYMVAGQPPEHEAPDTQAVQAPEANVYPVAHVAHPLDE